MKTLFEGLNKRSSNKKIIFRRRINSLQIYLFIRDVWNKDNTCYSKLRITDKHKIYFTWVHPDIMFSHLCSPAASPGYIQPSLMIK